MSNSKAQGVRSIHIPGQTIVVSVDDETYQITSDNKDFSVVEALVKQKKWDQVFNILGKIKTVQKYTEGDVTISGGDVLYKGKPVHGYVVEKLLAMLTEASSDWKPLARFLEKLMESQYDHVKEHLYKFLEYGNIPLTPDGDFLGYKYVRADYKDAHSGTMDNSPGKTVTMPREKVTSDPHQACSSGLHVGTKQYSATCQSHVVIVKVDPRNVVSVPFDYGHQKLRCCEYYVVSDYNPEKPLTSEVYNVTEKREVEKYVAPAKSIPVRGPDGRFIKKSEVKPVKKSP